MNNNLKLKREKGKVQGEIKNLMIFFFLTFSFSLFPFPFSALAEVADRVVAIVGTEVITLYDVDRVMAQFSTEIAKAKNRDEKFKTVKREVLDRLIDDLLLKQAVMDAKIEVTSDDVARAIKNVLTQNQISIDVLKAELAKKGVSYESYKDDIKRNIERIKFINQQIGSVVKISDADLRDYYQKHMEEFGGKQSAHIAQIVLPFEEGTTKEKAFELKAKGTELVKQARGGTSFAALAKQYSKGPNAETGGDLGIVEPGKLLPEISAALENIKVGQISDPIMSPAGVHIIYLIDRARPTEADFEKMKEQVYNRMYDQRMTEALDQYLSEQRKKTFVQVKE